MILTNSKSFDYTELIVQMIELPEKVQKNIFKQVDALYTKHLYKNGNSIKKSKKEIEKPIISKEMRTELKRRIQSYEKNPTNVYSWDDVKNRIEKRIPK